jgi:hypothetical protein
MMAAYDQMLQYRNSVSLLTLLIAHTNEMRDRINPSLTPTQLCRQQQKQQRQSLNTSICLAFKTFEQPKSKQVE